MIPSSFFKVKNKETNEVGTVISRSFGVDGETVTIFWSSKRNKEKYCLKTGNDIYKFYDCFEYIESSYDQLTKKEIVDIIKKEYCGSILDVLLKRKNLPDYFKVGSLVYFTKPGYIPWNREDYGPGQPFIIIDKINRDTFVYMNPNSEPEFILCLSSYEPEKDDVNDYVEVIRIRSSLVNFYSDDAFHILSRYDYEF